MDINGLPMTLHFTQEELVQYLYNDTSQEKLAAIESALQQDWSLREELEALKVSSACLGTALQSPRTEVVLNVLNYARETFAESVQDR
jgi:hypothetical protein